MAKCCFLTIFIVKFEYEKNLKFWFDFIYIVVVAMETN